MGVNKVIYDNRTLIDLENDTVTSNTLFQGVTAHDASGTSITGTYTPITSYDDLSDKPQINGVTLSGDSSSSDLGLADETHSHIWSDISNPPSTYEPTPTPIFTVRNITLTNQTNVSASSYASWTQTAPAVTGYTAIAVTDVYLYNNTAFVCNRARLSDDHSTINMSVRNLASSKQSMSSNSYIRVLYIKDGWFT